MPGKSRVGICVGVYTRDIRVYAAAKLQGYKCWCSSWSLYRGLRAGAAVGAYNRDIRANAAVGAFTSTIKADASAGASKRDIRTDAAVGAYTRALELLLLLELMSET